jgi:hypothetical protein
MNMPQSTKKLNFMIRRELAKELEELVPPASAAGL